MKCRKILPVDTAAAKAGFSARTGYRLQRDSRPPSESKLSRGSRRPDPLAGIFLEEVVSILQKTPELRSVAIFHELQRRHSQLKDGVRRTLERRVSQWKAEHGSDRPVIFPQTYVTGRLGISDYTAMGRLGITGNEKKLDHLLYHFRLPCRALRMLTWC